MLLCNSFHEALNQFRLKGSYCDLTIRVEEKIFQCHRIVLASGCDYFKNLLCGNFKESCSEVKDITLRDIDAVSFEIILEFIYSGRKPSCDTDNIYGLLRSSDFLQFQAVKNVCVEYVLNYVSSFSSVCVFEVLHLSCAMNDLLLMDTLSKHSANYLKDLVRKDFFKDMAYDCFNLILQQYRFASVIKFTNENFLLDAVIRWVHFNLEDRRQFFQNLIDTIDFGQITEDCVEFLLKEYKINREMNLESDQNTSAGLKTLVLEAFSLKKLVDDDDILPIPYQDPPLEITPSIYFYARLKNYSTRKSTFTVLSLQEPNDCEVKDVKSSSNLSSVNNLAVKPNWNVSCSFSLNAFGFVLALSKKSNNIYCSSSNREFLAYNSVDFSSDQYTKLSPPPSYFGIGLGDVRTCGTDDGDIYFLRKSNHKIFYRYNCNVDKWVPIDFGLITPVKEFSCVAHDNLLYIIEGEDSESNEVLEEYIQAYDYRAPRWLELSRSKAKKRSHFTSEVGLSELRPSRRAYCPTSCVADGKIYVYNGTRFKVFEPVARKWRNIKLDAAWLGRNSEELKLIPYEKKLFVFGSISWRYFSYNITTNTLERPVLYNPNFNVEYHQVVDVIALNTREM